MTIFTQWKKPPTKADPVSMEVRVKKAGYIPIKKQIEILQQTGQRLREMRELEYDYQPGEQVEDDGRYDPTRAPGIDAVDIQRMAETIKPLPPAQAAEKAASSPPAKSPPVEGSEPPPAGG